MTEMKSLSIWILIWVYNHFLIHNGSRERPDDIFVKAVIDNDGVGIWRVRVQGLTLDIIVLPLFIIVFTLNDRCGTNDVLI